jgi:hypothetical protein
MKGIYAYKLDACKQTLSVTGPVWKLRFSDRSNFMKKGNAMKDAKFAYIAPAMAEADMTADAWCKCECGLFVGTGGGN